jgi:uncharacterized protein YjbI with pentapeptide repeats
MSNNLAPPDVATLERSLNDSATLVSAIWVSFLVFALYLLIAAAMVEHRQLFLDESVKLPVLNIDLSMPGFFVLAPSLVVIFHAYVLVQVILLGRTAAAYNEAVERVVERENISPKDEAALRQRLANTLFTQIFAGSPNERGGWLGSVLKAMAWITLAFAPILILGVFQFKFLPYHSSPVTWAHRGLILLELVVLFFSWPLVLHAGREFKWPKPRAPSLLAVCLLFVAVPLSVLTFPGEKHVNLATGHWPNDVQCERWVQREIKGIDLRFDRLVLPHAYLIDHDKLEKIAAETSAAGELPNQGERTHVLRGRDLNCGDFSNFTDLRRVDFADAQLQNANFITAKLQGASLVRAQLQRANFSGANLQRVLLNSANLEFANLYNARLRSASLDGAKLQGAQLKCGRLQGATFNVQRQDASLEGAAQFQGVSLDGAAQLQGVSLDAAAQLQGASLDGAKLQGASLIGAQLQGATLNSAQLQGASLDGANLQGASLIGAQLQGASLDGANLQGASLDRASLHGADFGSSLLQYATILDAHVWRARIANACITSRVNNHQPNTIMALSPVEAAPDEIANFIERSVVDIPEWSVRDEARKRLGGGDTENIEKMWSECEHASTKPSPKEFNEKFDQDRAEFLRKLVCEDARNGKAVAQGIIRNWIDDTNPLISENHERREFSTRLAFLLSGTECQPMKQLGEKTKEILDRAKTKKTPYRAAKLGAPSYLEQRMNPSTCPD